MKTNQKVILYVDDDPDDREFLLQAIKMKDPDIEVLLAENGLRALDCLSTMKEKQAGMPCLIVLDLNMPYLDGKETFQRLRKDADLKSVPVIVFSSSEKPSDKAMFTNMGIEYFTKPTEINYLYSIANHMVSLCC